jgi:hypothetical protein
VVRELPKLLRDLHVQEIATISNDAALGEVTVSEYQQEILRAVMRMAKAICDVHNRDALLKAYNWAICAEDRKRNPKQRGRSPVSGEGLSLSTSELTSAIVEIAAILAGKNPDIRNRRVLIQTLKHFRRTEARERTPRRRGRPRADRFRLAVVEARHSGPDCTGAKNPHATAARILKADAYGMSDRKLEAQIKAIRESSSTSSKS